MNKMKLLNTVVLSDLPAQDKCLLQELILRADDEGMCWPKVERLCKARGMKHTKNFKGAEHYLPGLVSKTRRGRKNFYVLNTPAIEGLLEAEVEVKETPRKPNTPATEGVYTPATEGVSEVNTPATEGVYTPATEGANSSSNTSPKNDSSEDSSPAVANAPSGDPEVTDVSKTMKPSVTSEADQGGSTTRKGTSSDDTPATEGVLDSAFAKTWALMDVGTRRYFENSGATPEQLRQAVMHYDQTHSSFGWLHKAETALAKAGVEIEEW